MKKNEINYYSYREARAAATAPGATQEDIDALGEWFSRYGEQYWNGESYNADDGLTVYPIVKWDEENEQGEVIGCELR